MIDFYNKIPWARLHELWTNETFRNQWFGLLLISILAFAISIFFHNIVLKKLDAKGVKPGKTTLWRPATVNLISPLVFLSLIILNIAIFRAFEFETKSFLEPGLYASLAWLAFRISRIFTSNRVWLRLIAFILFALVTLQSFGILTATIDLLELIAFRFGEKRISLLNLINGLMVLLPLLWVTTFMGSAGEKKIKQLPNLPPSLQVLLSKLIRTSLIVISFAVALSTIGLDLSSFAILGGAIGVGIGFGLQKVVSNLVSGLILLIDRSIKPGDVIEIEGTYGWINSLRARYASVITRDGKEHLIPNEDLITNRVINWSFSDRNVRVRAPIGISYSSDPRKAINLCLEAAKSSSRTLEDPEPRCLVTSFGDNSINLELRFWIDDPSNGVGNIRSEVLLSIWDRFKENEIEIPFPQRDIRIINDSEDNLS
ncbi:MAG: mechanosensitive ion channel domain-containing protein [Verrucomicrobiota bacterium]|nr:mechanosensitive ion channel domain-containing protein [Verrucomicrobiota bacterium]